MLGKFSANIYTGDDNEAHPVLIINDQPSCDNTLVSSTAQDGNSQHFGHKIYQLFIGSTTQRHYTQRM